MQATDAIVEFAVLHKKPFAVVPCCVFPRLFPQRRIIADMLDDARDAALHNPGFPATKDVLTHIDLVAYLKQLGGQDACVDFLPFEGMNQVVWRR